MEFNRIKEIDRCENRNSIEVSSNGNFFEIMEKIKVNIKKDSVAAKAFKAFMAEKDAFRQAVQSGNVNSYAKKREAQSAQPV